MNPVYAIAIPVFVITMVLECRLARHDDERGYEARDSAASLSMGLGYLAIQTVMKTLHVAFFLWLYEHRLFTLEQSAVTWLMLLVADDLCYYAYHRSHHEIRVLWASHENHHSSQRYNLSTALRQSWTSPFTSPWFWAPLPLLGFPVEMILLQQVFSLLYQYWIHTEHIDRLGMLEWVFNTPSHHRVHHGSNDRYLDRNHGGILIIWDRMFGTYQEELAEDPVVYGLTTNIDSFNPFVIATHEFVAMGRDIRDASSWRGRLGAVFGPPGWQPHQAVPTSLRSEALPPTC